jgi:hypothetical protein
LQTCGACGSVSAGYESFCTMCGAAVARAANLSAPVSPTADGAARRASESPPPTAAEPWATTTFGQHEPMSHDHLRYEAWPQQRPALKGAAVLAATLAAAVLGAGVAVTLALPLMDITAMPAAAQRGPAPATSPAPAGSGATSDRATSDSGSASTGRVAATKIPRPLQPAHASATCTAEPSQDGAGNVVSYEAFQVVDGIRETAWRCPGSAVGERLVLQFAEPVTVTSVALVPGYDKRDPFDGVDRFTDNRTVTSAVWSFDGGSGTQQVIPDPDRALQQLRLPDPVRTMTVTLEIAGTGNSAARRDFTAISEVRISGY